MNNDMKHAINPDDPVDRADTMLVSGFRLGLGAFLIILLMLVGLAMVQAGWMAWATLAIISGVGIGIAAIVLVIVFLLS